MPGLILPFYESVVEQVQQQIGIISARRVHTVSNKGGIISKKENKIQGDYTIRPNIPDLDSKHEKITIKPNIRNDRT